MNASEMAYLEEAQAHYSTRLQRFYAETALKNLSAIMHHDGGQTYDGATSIVEAVHECTETLERMVKELGELRDLRDMVNHDNGEEASKAADPSQAAIEARLNLAHEREVADEIERELELLRKTYDLAVEDLKLELLRMGEQ